MRGFTYKFSKSNENRIFPFRCHYWVMVEKISWWHQGSHKLKPIPSMWSFWSVGQEPDHIYIVWLDINPTSVCNDASLSHTEAFNIDTENTLHAHTLALTLVYTQTCTHTGWPSSLREGGYPSFHCCLPVSGRRLPWKQGLTGNNSRERKKSGALPTSPLLLLCVPLSKYPFSTCDAFRTNYRFFTG